MSLRAELNNEAFVFLDSKWMKEADIPSAFSSSRENLQIDASREIQSDQTLWEQNKALWELKGALWWENQALKKETAALQGLRMENYGVQVTRDESLQKKPQQDKNPLEGLPILSLPDSVANKALRGLRDEKRTLPVFWENNAALKTFPDKLFPGKMNSMPVLQVEKLTERSLGKEEPAVPETSQAVTVHEKSHKATLPQADIAVPEIQEESGTSPVPDRNKTPVSVLEEKELSLFFRKLEGIVQALLREKQQLLEEKRDFSTLKRENKTLREENEKLRLQLGSVRGFIHKIVAHMNAMLLQLKTFAFLLQAEEETEKPESC